MLHHTFLVKTKKKTLGPSPKTCTFSVCAFCCFSKSPMVILLHGRNNINRPDCNNSDSCCNPNGAKSLPLFFLVRVVDRDDFPVEGVAEAGFGCLEEGTKVLPSTQSINGHRVASVVVSWLMSRSQAKKLWPISPHSSV